MADSDHPVEGGVIGMSPAAEEAPIAVLATDEEHGAFADVRLLV